MKHNLINLAALLSLGVSATAEVRLPNLFSDHMVLQRDKVIKVWGRAGAGEEVKVVLAGKSADATTAADGRWKVELPAMKAGGPHELTVTGANRVKIADILIGEVWVCSGQSNMEFELKWAKDAPQEIKDADYPQIRLLHVPRTPSDQPLDELKASWFVCSPTSAELPDFTAVGYFFAREIHNTIKVPVGIITAAQGATTVEQWTPPELTTGGGELYNGMIHPLIPFGIRGALWYQGESNCGDGAGYLPKQRTLIERWRKLWQQGDFPFYYVQITPNRYGGALPLLLEAQDAAMAIPNTGMAASTDTCDASDNFGGGHPRNKQEIGRRLALWALAKDYGQKDLVYRGPSWVSVKADGAALRIGFGYVGGGLVTRDHKAPDYFEIAGADGKFVDAVAKIDGATVVISSGKVADPTAMRFAWQDLAQPNLMNREGLPVSPFRADVGKEKGSK